jgi:hypothetical protein
MAQIYSATRVLNDMYVQGNVNNNRNDDDDDDDDNNDNNNNNNNKSLSPSVQNTILGHSWMYWCCS